LNSSRLFPHTIKLALAAASGLMLTCSFPKIGWHWMAWGSLVPLLFSLEETTPFSGFRLGLLSGLSHQVTLIYWMTLTMNQYGQLPWAVSIPVMLLLALYLALYPAAFSWLLVKCIKDPFLKMVSIPFLWTALEYIRTHLFTGFPWELLGYSQAGNIHLIQLADFSGVYGVSFLIALINALLFFTLHPFFYKQESRRISRLYSIGLPIAGWVVLVLVWIYGEYRIRQTDETMKNSPSSRIAVVQGNIEQSLKWDPAFQEETLRKYGYLSFSVKADAPDLVVWPETATPFYFLYDKPLTDRVLKIIRRTDTDFLFGSPSFLMKDKALHYFNSAYLLDAKGLVKGKYDKIHLVPYGEYVPLKKWLPFIGKMVENVGDFQAGPKGSLIAWKGFRLGILICYEDIFPDLSRQAVKNGASVLINITNDAWYGRTSAPYQHFSMAVFRSVENRRSLVRSANTGFSGFIDPNGRVLKSTELFQDAALTHAVPMLSGLTPYTRMGDVFAWICLVLSLGLVLAGSRRNSGTPKTRS
jgi:apolipoprotein N-acyltransferase